MAETIIKVENLGKKYSIGVRETSKSLGQTMANIFQYRKSKKEFWALKNINFKVEEGEVFGIIGPNGAGKSTLLKVFSQITSPTVGKITMKGRVSSLLEVGTGFHPELTGRENIYLNGAILGMKRQEINQKFSQIVSFANIGEFLDTPVKHYSSGMYLRLAFAVAAHLEPEILIVDEVLAVGDANFQKKCLEKMNDIGKSGKAVLFVSHNMAAIKSLCQRAVLLKKGKIVAIGKASAVVNQYLGGEGHPSVFERVWRSKTSAPQNQTVILNRVRLCDRQGKLLKHIDTDTPFAIEIDYKTKTQDSHVGFTIIFYDGENNCILASINNHEKNWYNKPMPRGNYRSICHIPKNLFDNGNFSLGMMLFGRNFSDAVKVDEILNLDILDGAEVRGDYYGAYDSRIRPLLNWETEKGNN